jgi:Sulfotransferase family
VNPEIRFHPAAGAFERPLVREHVRPVARTAFYAVRGARARGLARVRRTRTRYVQAPVFIIGCGRSGTTLLGNLFGMHPVVRYLHEPYDLWTAIEPATDVLQLYSRGEHHALLDAGAVTAAARRRFGRLISAPPGLTVVEKSPTNALRIGYLDAMAADARFIHIVRDGVEVSRSIERMAAVTRRMLFRPNLNEWWGVDDVKWTALEQDGKAVGYYPDEAKLLSSDAQRGAYEWLISLREVDTWRIRLGSRLVELRYQDLTSSPRATLQRVTDSLQLACPAEWLEEAATLVSPANTRRGEGLALPDRMRADFNGLQESFGFKGRAVSTASGANDLSAPQASL